MAGEERPRTKRLADPEEVARRTGRLREEHVAPLTALVERIRERRCDAVPWFDPESAGIAAEVLLLFEAPGPRAVGPGPIRPDRPGSGFISPDNNDTSAENVLRLEAAAGLDRMRVLHWNIVPWYVGDGTRIRPVNARDLDEARPWLAELLDLLPKLRVLVLCGTRASDGWDRYDGPRPESLRVLWCPHPSPVNLNTRPEARDEILATFHEAALVLDPPPCPVCGAPGMPIIYGMPGFDMFEASERGELILGGCIVGDDDPNFGCVEGHQWRVPAPQLPAGPRDPKAVRARRPRTTVDVHHAEGHPDAEFRSGLTPLQEHARQALGELVERSGTSAVRIGHLQLLADLFDEWANAHAEDRPGGRFFTGTGGTGLWHVLQGLHPLDNPRRWNSLRAAVVRQLEVDGRWRRTSQPRGSTFELFDQPTEEKSEEHTGSVPSADVSEREGHGE